MISERSANILETEISTDASDLVAKCSRGTPRVANRILKRVRDFAQIQAKGKIDFEISKSALGRLEIEELGLKKIDIRLLKILIDHYDGGPVGAKTLAVSLGEEADTI